MNYRRFNRGIGRINSSWGARVLSMQETKGSSGPDLSDSLKFVEVKSGRDNNNWTLVNGQHKYSFDKPCFLFLVKYYLREGMNRLTRESDILGRVSYLVDWKTVEGWPVSSKGGKEYVYPRLEDISVLKSYSVDGGTLHVAKGVNISLFGIIGRQLNLEPS